MSIIGLVGPTCCGKMTFCKLMQERKNYRVIEFDKVEDIKQAVSSVYNTWKEPTIISPISTKSQFKIWKKRNYFHLIFLDAPIHIRYRRYVKKYGQIEFEAFIAIDDKLRYHISFLELSKSCKVFLKNGTNSIEKFNDYIDSQMHTIIRPFRPNWDVYFMKIAYTIKSRSNCMKKSVGAILVNEHKRILSTSYNGTPKVMKNCNEGGCDVCRKSKQLDLELYKCMCIHAEEGCILELGITQTRGCTLYSTLFPCVWCCKALLQAGVTRIVYGEQGHWDLSLNFLGGLIKYEKVDLDQYIY